MKKVVIGLSLLGIVIGAYVWSNKDEDNERLLPPLPPLDDLIEPLDDNKLNNDEPDVMLNPPPFLDNDMKQGGYNDPWAKSDDDIFSGKAKV